VRLTLIFNNGKSLYFLEEMDPAPLQLPKLQSDQLPLYPHFFIKTLCHDYVDSYYSKNWGFLAVGCRKFETDIMFPVIYSEQPCDGA
jgi:hypothetical protein